MGSTSDWETMKSAAKVLEEFGVAYEAKAMSAHRTPKAVVEWTEAAAKNGMKAIIAAAAGGGRAPRGRGRGAYDPAGARRADAFEAPAGPGFAALHGADAQGNSRRDLRHRRGWRGECSAFCRCLACSLRPRARKKLSEFRAKQTDAVLKAAPLRL